MRPQEIIIKIYLSSDYRVESAKAYKKDVDDERGKEQQKENVYKMNKAITPFSTPFHLIEQK